MFDVAEYEVPDDTVIWRYMDVSKLLDILVNEQLVFPRLDSFEDVYEGNPLKFKEAMNYAFRTTEEHGLADNVNNTVETWFKCTKVRTYISCWHMNDVESAGMWKLYCQSKESLAIKTTVGQLKRSLTTPNSEYVDSLVFGKVDYSNDLENLKQRYLELAAKKEPIDISYFDTSFSKRPSFEHEHELRALAFKKDKIIEHLHKDLTAEQLKTTTPFVQIVKCDVRLLIDEIIIAPDAPSWFKGMLINLLQKLNFDFNIIQSDLYTLK